MSHALFVPWPQEADRSLYTVCPAPDLPNVRRRQPPVAERLLIFETRRCSPGSACSPLPFRRKKTTVRWYLNAVDVLHVRAEPRGVVHLALEEDPRHLGWNIVEVDPNEGDIVGAGSPKRRRTHHQLHRTDRKQWPLRSKTSAQVSIRRFCTLSRHSESGLLTVGRAPRNPSSESDWRMDGCRYIFRRKHESAVSRWRQCPCFQETT